MASTLVWILVGYAVAGGLFAIPFAWVGAGALDEAARDGTVGFRILILPGAAAFWPFLLLRWIRTRREPR